MPSTGCFAVKHPTPEANSSPRSCPPSSLAKKEKYPLWTPLKRKKCLKCERESSHTLWKSLRDSHIPTASTTGYMSSHAFQSNHRHRKGLVTDVSGPQRNACLGTLTS